MCLYYTWSHLFMLIIRLTCKPILIYYVNGVLLMRMVYLIHIFLPSTVFIYLFKIIFGSLQWWKTRDWQKNWLKGTYTTVFANTSLQVESFYERAHCLIHSGIFGGTWKKNPLGELCIKFYLVLFVSGHSEHPYRAWRIIEFKSSF